MDFHHAITVNDFRQGSTATIWHWQVRSTLMPV